MSRQISDVQAVILAYRYFHLFFLFTVVYRSSFMLATMTEHGIASRDMSRVEAEALLSGAPLQPGLWRRFSLLAGIVAVLLIALGS